MKKHRPPLGLAAHYLNLAGLPNSCFGPVILSGLPLIRREKTDIVLLQIGPNITPKTLFQREGDDDSSALASRHNDPIRAFAGREKETTSQMENFCQEHPKICTI